MKHTLPKTLPGNWIASYKLDSREGCYESFVVIRATAKGSYDKFQVHTASYKDEGEEQGWFYRSGDYVKTLESANKRFLRRAGLMVDAAEEIAA